MPGVQSPLPPRPRSQAPGNLQPLHAQEEEGVRPGGRARQGHGGREVRAPREERARTQGKARSTWNVKTTRSIICIKHILPTKLNKM